MRKVLVAALLVLAPGCSRSGEVRPPAPPSNEVWIAPEQAAAMDLAAEPVGEAVVDAAVSTVGRLAFDDRKVAHVYSPVSGRVTRLLADLGQGVKAGQALALIDSPDLGGALADLRKAEAVLAAAEKEHRRQEELFEGHAGAARDLEAAEAAWRTALAERDRCRQRADLFHGGTADRVRQGFELRSPIAGEVIARGANPGLELSGQYGQGGAVELYTVGDLSGLFLLADVPEMDAPRVRRGSRVRFEVAGRTLRGEVDWVAGTLDPATRTVRIRVPVPNRDRTLKPEMFAKVVVEVEGRRAPVLPRGAVVRLGEAACVFLDLGERDGRRRFERRPVQVDETVPGDLLPIRAGVAPGERVVVRGALQLSGVNG